ncbi:trypsin-like peptidase domain-containing protein [Streptomyces lushanensis]|uniref:trypsin-like peptidase domain-containing protein n=1 Tax=Streptomyces lushanensis TaxID=1434255 RepID=UPI0008328E7A|nr:trypsin-like peptidase domain-containing protein [Streptomyces lushanensis]
MTSVGYWVDLYQGEQRLGGGFLVDRWRVITALHCLGGLTALDADLDIVLADGSQVEGRVRRQDEGADLALIEISSQFDVTRPIPVAGVAQGGERWRSPYRPAENEAELGGHVDNGALAYKCVGGAKIEALQLTASQPLGDFSGYSGGPVESTAPDREPAVLGILLEQLPDRASPHSGRYTNVLFAATIGEAMRRLNLLDAGHLMDVLRPGRSEHVPQLMSGADSSPLTPANRMARVDSAMRIIQQLSDLGVMDPVSADQVKFHAVKLIMQEEPSGGEE